MGYKARQGRRKDSGKISKLHNVKQCSISKDLPISYLQKCADGEVVVRSRFTKLIEKVVYNSLYNTQIGLQYTHTHTYAHTY